MLSSHMTLPFHLNTLPMQYFIYLDFEGEKMKRKIYISYVGSITTTIQISPLFTLVLKDTGHWSKLSKCFLRICEESELTQD